jgi:hypothetical protein
MAIFGGSPPDPFASLQLLALGQPLHSWAHSSFVGALLVSFLLMVFLKKSLMYSHHFFAGDHKDV